MFDSNIFNKTNRKIEQIWASNFSIEQPSVGRLVMRSLKPMQYY